MRIRIKTLELSWKRFFFLYFVLALFYILYSLFYYRPTFALTSGTCSQTGTPIANGLLSTPNLGSNGIVNSSGACIIDPKAAFAPYRLPTFDDLRSLYYDQAKTVSTVNKNDPLVGKKSNGDPFDQNSIPLTSNKDQLYFIKKTNSSSDGNLDITGNIPGNQTGLVFVEGNLNIGPMPGANPPNKLQGNNNSGLVFIVKGDVVIDSSVSKIDAIIISEGTIYTAGANCTSSSVSTSGPLIVNGSLVSLKQPPTSDPNASYIKFCRTLIDNSQAAEQINQDPKYLVILRDLMSDTFQRWSEIQ